MLGGSWDRIRNQDLCVKTLRERVAKVPPEDVIDQVTRGILGGVYLTRWLQETRGVVPLTGWWVARPNVAKEVCGSHQTPADLVLEVKGDVGPTYLQGVSIKSTSSLYTDIGFKNRGIGVVGNLLGVDFKKEIVNPLVKAVEALLGLPPTNTKKKILIRSQPETTQVLTQKFGTECLGLLRERLYQVLSSMDQASLLEHLLVHWLDCTCPLPWVKLTTGSTPRGRFSVMVSEPVTGVGNDLSVVTRDPSSKVEVCRVGTDSVGIKVGERRLLKIRWKFESEKLASVIKLSGDPWVDVEPRSSVSVSGSKVHGLDRPPRTQEREGGKPVGDPVHDTNDLSMSVDDRTPRGPRCKGDVHVDPTPWQSHVHQPLPS